MVRTGEAAGLASVTVVVRRRGRGPPARLDFLAKQLVHEEGAAVVRDILRAAPHLAVATAINRVGVRAYKVVTKRRTHCARQALVEDGVVVRRVFATRLVVISRLISFKGGMHDYETSKA